MQGLSRAVKDISGGKIGSLVLAVTILEMLLQYRSLMRILLMISAAMACMTQISCTRSRGPAELKLTVNVPFRFIAYGDTRFHDPKDTEAANPTARQALVQAIARANPAFVSFGGDIVYNGYDLEDWKDWDNETEVWREKKIVVYPALGNHDLHGNEKVALANYFRRFPELKNNRYYSVRAANTLMIVLDSSLDETSGPQGQWLTEKLNTIPSDVDFVFVVLHHPPYTSSSDEKKYGGGHSARSPEQLFAKSTGWTCCTRGWWPGSCSLARGSRWPRRRPPGCSGILPAQGHYIARRLDADIALYDPRATRSCRRRPRDMVVDYSAYEGMSIAGRPCGPCRPGVSW